MYSFLKFFKNAIVFVFLSLYSFAQNAPIKYGKIELADLQMKAYSKDSSAEAVVLGDIGHAYFEYSSSTGFNVVYERHRRVKIFKKSGYDWANIEVPLYRNINGRGEIDLYDLKGYTYNIENGEVVKEKLEKESVFSEKVDESHSTKKITFPKVKEGSIIDYSYKIRSSFFYNFSDWVFQSSIPVVWSEFSVSVPEYFNYRQIMQGYEPVFINTVENGEVAFSIKIRNQIAEGNNQSKYQQASIQQLNVPTKEYRWAMKDIPAFREEPFMTTIEDYVSKIQFELSSTNMPDSPIKSYAENWESLNTRLVEHGFFGQQLNNFTYFKELVTTIKASSPDTLAQIDMAYQFIKQNIKWNEKENIYIRSTLSQCLATKSGNIAEVNLLLVLLLRELGYDANPVILSTRDNGRILDNYVLLSKFNYVIAQVNVGGKDLLIDGTSLHTPLGILPTNCLNGSGRLISKREPRWVDLISSYKFIETTICKFELTTDGHAIGDLTTSYLGYNSINERNKYNKEGKEKYMDNYKRKNENWQVTQMDISNVENASKPFIRKQDLTVSDIATISADKIYFNPILYKSQKENPFKNPNRKFPVDFTSLFEENFLATYTLPQAYMVEELPKGIRATLPENGGVFTYAISASDDGKVVVSSKLSLKRTQYFVEEYETLRKFFDQIIQKQAEQIVLKKK